MFKSAMSAFLVALFCCPAFGYQALVIACHDGDTVRVRRANSRTKTYGQYNRNDLADVLKSHYARRRSTCSKNAGVEKIRLAGIDAPELAQPFGVESRNYLETLVLGEKVEILEKATDRYGRKVAEIITADGIDVNHSLVQHGFAWRYPNFAKGDAELLPLENAARQDGLGLWANPAAEAPWIFRKQTAFEATLKQASQTSKSAQAI